jgi:hypothetical protein
MAMAETHKSGAGRYLVVYLCILAIAALQFVIGDWPSLSCLFLLRGCPALVPPFFWRDRAGVFLLMTARTAPAFAKNAKGWATPKFILTERLGQLPTRLKRYCKAKHPHFIPCSCFCLYSEPGSGEFARMAADDQAAADVLRSLMPTNPTHSQRTRMNGAPGSELGARS